LRIDFACLVVVNDFLAREKDWLGEIVQGKPLPRDYFIRLHYLGVPVKSFTRKADGNKMSIRDSVVAQAHQFYFFLINFKPSFFPNFTVSGCLKAFAKLKYSPGAFAMRFAVSLGWAKVPLSKQNLVIFENHNT